MKDFFQLNKLSTLHNNETIFFCKTDFIINEFEKIKKKNNHIVLITGNSDYPITDEHIKILPKNVIKWFAVNALSNSEIIEPLPLGLENKNYSKREGHGIGYLERMIEKENHLNQQVNLIPTKLIYSNFNIYTNLGVRSIYKYISQTTPFIDWEDNNLTLYDYYQKIYNYKMILCPIGNGIDTHRLWETLYANRTPIIVKHGEFKIYDLYKKLPIVILDKIEDLKNEDLILKKYNEVQKNDYNNEMLNCSFWENKILSSLNK